MKLIRIEKPGAFTYAPVVVRDRTSWRSQAARIHFHLDPAVRNAVKNSNAFVGIIFNAGYIRIVAPAF